MRHTKSKGLGLLIAAALVLGACSPATSTPPSAGTLPATGNALAPASTPAVTAVSSPAVAATSPVAPAPTLQSKDPTTFTYLPVSGDPDTLDPAFDYETTGGQVIQNTYETLIFYNKGDANSFVPQLAIEVPSQSNGGISADGKTYTFKIRAGVKFHNGDTLTPDDVAFTFQRGLLQGGLSSPQWLLFQPILGVAASPSGNNDITDLVDPSGKLGDNQEAVLLADPAKLLAACQAVTSAIVADDAAGTVTFHLAQPWGPLLATLAAIWGSVSDKKWVGAHGGWDGDCHTWQKFYQTQSADINQLGIGTNENGTGPYVLDHWTHGKEIVLKAFAGYWRTEPAWPGGPAGAPGLKTIIIILNVPKFSERLAAVQAGDADTIDANVSTDWLQEDPLAGETCDQSGACQPGSSPNGPLRVFKSLAPVSRNDMLFNFKIDTAGGNDFIGSGKLDGAGIPSDFFTDLHVRKAFNYCFDWAAYLKSYQLGEGEQSYDLMLPGEIGYSENDPHYEYDLNKCRAEFQASALKGPDGAGLWDTGFHFTLPYNSSQLGPLYSIREIPTQILSRNLKAVNPKFVVDAIDLPWLTFLAAQRARKLPLFVTGWLEDIHDPHNWLVPYVQGTYAAWQSLPPDLVQQLSVFINEGVAETDRAKRAASYHQFNQAFYNAAPDILLTVEYVRHYEQRWVQGYYYNPIYAGYYFYALSKK